ncbi:MAG: hypothetical protein ABW175_05825 [Bradyrhizobium sp.]
MSTASILGGAIFNDPTYKDHINRFYYPLDAMKRSVATLKAASDRIDIATMEFGQYQPVLSPLQSWPEGKGKHWWREMGRARIDLTAQASSMSLSNDEPDVKPPTKCALLDAAIRKCFNSQPDPIPMLIDVEEQPHDSPNANTHDIRVVWEYGGSGSVPTLLRLTMVCPFRAPRKT